MTGTTMTLAATAVGTAVSLLLAAQGPVDAGEWFRTGALLAPRYQHSATRLTDGRVLVAGGRGLKTAYLQTTELFEPRTSEWIPAGRLANARYYHSATLLENGSVLVAGGINDAGHLSSVELFDAATGTWRDASPMLTPRREHTATLLRDGRVLVAGGQTGAGTPVAASEIYDPRLNRWSATAPLRLARRSAAATLLPDGQVLVAGGTGAEGTLAAVEAFDSERNQWRDAASMGVAREYHTSTLLPTAEVMVIGGIGLQGPVSVSEIYSLEQHRWFEGAPLLAARYDHRVALLPDHRLLVAGGVDRHTRTLASAEFYDPRKRAFEHVAAATQRRYGASATVLANGNVLVVGGAGRFNADGESWLAHTEVFAPALGHWQHASTTTVPGAIRLLEGGAAIVNRHSAKPSARITFVDTNGERREGAALSIARTQQSATVLRSGSLLVAGGTDAAGRTLASTEVYDPHLRLWRAAAAMMEPRAGHAAIVLSDGRLLVSGGHNGQRTIKTAEVFDAVAEKWRVVASLSSARRHHTMSLLADGSVLAAGGDDDGSVAGAEIFDVHAGRWTPADSLRDPRAKHTATLLPNGMILVTGGDGPGNTVLDSTELYDPSTRSWRQGPTMLASRSGHTAAVTNRGTVLVANDAAHAEEFVFFPPTTRRPPAPHILRMPGLAAGAVGTVEGRNLTDRLSRSGGGFQHSPADVPTVTLLSLVFDAHATISASPSRWSSTAIDIQVPGDFPSGAAVLTLSVGGAAFDVRGVQVGR